MENNKTGNEFEETKQKNDNELVLNSIKKDNSELNTMTYDWKELSNSRNLKPKRKGLKILISLLAFILIICGSAFAYLKFFKPDSQKIYSVILKECSKNITKEIDNTANRTTHSYTQNGNITINTNIDDYKLYNGISLDYSLGIDLNSKIFNTDISYKEKEKDILDMTVYIQDKNVYLKSDQIYNKLLFLEALPEDYDFINISQEDIKDIKYLFEQSSKYLQQSLEKAEYKTEKGTVLIKGKKNIVQKNIMIINKNNINDIKNEILNSIKNDSRIINTIVKLYDISQEDLMKTIEESVNEDASLNFESLVIELDTQYITNKILGLKAVENNETLINAVSTGKKTYDVTIDKSFKGKLTVNNQNNISFETVYEGYNFYIEIITTDNQDNYQLTTKIKDKKGKEANIIFKNNITDKKVEKVSMKDATDISKLSSNEQETIAANYNKLSSSSEFLKTIFANQE